MTFYQLDMFDRWAIESRIKRAERQISADMAAVERQAAANMAEVRRQHQKTEGAIVELRCDMLEGMGDLAFQITAQGKQVAKNLVHIEAQQLMALQALQDHRRTLGLISDNLITGFERSFRAQDQIKASLARVEQDLHEMRQDVKKLHEAAANPATSAALEKYSVALQALALGQASDAMSAVNAAIMNDGIFQIVHVPQITFLRGSFYLGLYDDAENTWLDPGLAQKDFSKALQYSKGASELPLIKDRLAYSHFLLEQYDTAERLYSELQQDGGHLAKFDRGRCLLGMGDVYGAAQLFEGMFRDDPTLALLPAADPFCQDYALFFREVGLTMARARAQELERQELMAAEEKMRFTSERQRLVRIARVAFEDVPQNSLDNAMASIARIRSMCFDYGPELALAEAELRKRGIDEPLIAESAPADLERLTQIYTGEKDKVDRLISGSGLRPWQPAGPSDTLVAQMLAGVEQIERGSAAAAQGVTELVQAMALVMPKLAAKRRIVTGKANFDYEISDIDDVFRKSVATRHGVRLQEQVRSLDSELKSVQSYRAELSALRRTLRTLL